MGFMEDQFGAVVEMVTETDPPGHDWMPEGLRRAKAVLGNLVALTWCLLFVAAILRWLWICLESVAPAITGFARPLLEKNAYALCGTAALMFFFARILRRVTQFAEAMQMIWIYGLFKVSKELITTFTGTAPKVTEAVPAFFSVSTAGDLAAVLGRLFDRLF